ncbi:hypothetical protein MKW92_014812, partial [Papaver armeniacum]
IKKIIKDKFHALLEVEALVQAETVKLAVVDHLLAHLKCAVYAKRSEGAG